MAMVMMCITAKLKLLFSKFFGYYSCVTVPPMLIQRMQWTIVVTNYLVGG